jgi:hypothetical protein
MARRQPHGQNAPARSSVLAVLVTIALLGFGPVVLQVHGAIPLKLAVAAATIITITSWQVWRHKRAPGRAHRYTHPGTARPSRRRRTTRPPL